jgi:CheY-like chemotaxis protein
MKQCILLIEDNDPIRENTAEWLELSDYKVIVASGGKEALEMMTTIKNPDLILCDIMMPEMDGYEILEIIKKQYQLTSIPFIFFTAYGEKKDIEKGLQIGASDYIVKPFEPDELVQKIRKHLPPQVSLA